MVSRIEVREENHPDVVRHVHPRHVEVIKVSLAAGELAEVRNDLLRFLRNVIGRLVSLKVRSRPGSWPKRDAKQLVYCLLSMTSFPNLERAGVRQKQPVLT